MSDFENPYSPPGNEKAVAKNTSGDDGLGERGETTVRFAIGCVLVFASLVVVVWSLFEMRAGLFELSTAVGGTGVPRKPSDIAADMLLACWIGFGAVAVSAAGVLLMISAYRGSKD